MRRMLTSLCLIAVTATFAAIYLRTAKATDASGFAGATVAMGRFGAIDVFNQLIPRADSGGSAGNGNGNGNGNSAGNLWLSWQKTIGDSDVYVQNNVWQPGGSTGWHSHPGASLIIVTMGAVTTYEGGDSTCKGTVYSQGMGFVDPGGDHVHIIRNEGTVEARTMAVQTVPAGAVRRVDMPAPGNCAF